jgi:hypothetical protein
VLCEAEAVAVAVASLCHLVVEVANGRYHPSQPPSAAWSSPVKRPDRSSVAALTASGEAARSSTGLVP